MCSLFLYMFGAGRELSHALACYSNVIVQSLNSSQQQSKKQNVDQKLRSLETVYLLPIFSLGRIHTSCLGPVELQSGMGNRY